MARSLRWTGGTSLPMGRVRCCYHPVHRHLLSFTPPARLHAPHSAPMQATFFGTVEHGTRMTALAQHLCTVR
eukprot:m.213682 g.213682  ORF g.213682 m.213682 type:complete len:72 (+) comp19061_c0_seq6:2600-2815(+)